MPSTRFLIIFDSINRRLSKIGQKGGRKVNKYSMHMWCIKRAYNNAIEKNRPPTGGDHIGKN